MRDDPIELVQSAYDELCTKFSGVHQDDEMDSILLRLHAALKAMQTQAGFRILTNEHTELPRTFTGVKQGPCYGPMDGFQGPTLNTRNLPAYTPRITGKK